MTNPTPPPPIVTRAAKLSLDIAVAQLWQQTRSPEQAVEAIADVIWNDTCIAELANALRSIVADAKAGRSPSALALAEAEKALASCADAILQISA